MTDTSSLNGSSPPEAVWAVMVEVVTVPLERTTIKSRPSGRHPSLSTDNGSRLSPTYPNLPSNQQLVTLYDIYFRRRSRNDLYLSIYFILFSVVSVNIRKTKDDESCRCFYRSTVAYTRQPG